MNYTYVQRMKFGNLARPSVTWEIQVWGKINPNGLNLDKTNHEEDFAWTYAAAAAKSVQPHRRQPTRLPCPWDSPGKNTGVGCHFLLQCMKVKSESEVAQLCLTLSDPMHCSLPGSSVHGIFQGTCARPFIKFSSTVHKFSNVSHQLSLDFSFIGSLL